MEYGSIFWGNSTESEGIFSSRKENIQNYDWI
jgi:hypothetical protein